LIKDEAKEKLSNMTISYGIDLNNRFIEKEFIANSINQFVKATIDMDRLVNEDGYLDEYELVIAPYIKELADAYGDAWIFFSPYIDKKGHDVWYFDDNGDGINERIEEQDASFYEDRTGKEWYFVPMETKEAYWTDPYPEVDILPDSAITWVTYGLPIFIDDVFIGVAGTDFKLTDLEEELRQLRVYDTGYAVLLNDRYEFIVHPNFETLTGFNEVDIDGKYTILEAMRKGDEGIVEYEWAGSEKKILSFKRLTNGWIMSVTTSRNEVLRPLLLHFTVMFSLLGAGLILIVIVARFLSSTITKPLEKLTTVVQHIGKGNYDAEIPRDYLDNKDEIGILSNAVEDMKKHNRIYLHQIQEYSNNLENLVLKRTEQLEISHREVIETKKAQAVSNLVMEIAHRLNTPLGISITSITHIRNKMKKIFEKAVKSEENRECIDDMTAINESLDVVELSITSSAETVKTLQKYSDVTHVMICKETEMCEYISGITSYILMQHPLNNKIEIEIKCDGEIYTKTYPKLINELLSYLSDYSLLYSTRNLDICRILIKMHERDGLVLINYEDNGEFKYTDFADKAFEPFAFSSFQVGSSGLQVHLSHYIVTRGLKGSMRVYSHGGDQLGFEISLPMCVEDE